MREPAAHLCNNKRVQCGGRNTKQPERNWSPAVDITIIHSAAISATWLSLSNPLFGTAFFPIAATAVALSARPQELLHLFVHHSGLPNADAMLMVAEHLHNFLWRIAVVTQRGAVDPCSLGGHPHDSPSVTRPDRREEAEDVIRRPRVHGHLLKSDAHWGGFTAATTPPRNDTITRTTRATGSSSSSSSSRRLGGPTAHVQYASPAGVKSWCRWCYWRRWWC
jgi:hypothetical protein